MVLCVALAADLTLLPGPNAKAEPIATPCRVGARPQTNAAVPVSCLTAPEFAIDGLLITLDAPATAAERRDIRLGEQTRWFERPALAPPLDIAPSEDGVALKTSLNQWRAYGFETAARKMTAAGPFLPMAAPHAVKSSLDIWSSIDLQGPHSAIPHAFLASVGANYAFDKTAVVHVKGETEELTGSASGVVRHKLASAVTLKPAPAWSFGVETQWTRDDKHAAMPGHSPDAATLVVTPRLARAFAVGAGTTAEPFVTLKREISPARLDDAGKQTLPTQTGGVGVVLSKPESYSLTLSTDFEAPNAAKVAQTSSRFGLKIPLP
jgi:hypothetical protein